MGPRRHSSGSFALPSDQQTRRASASVIETTLLGRISNEMARAWLRDYEELGRAPTWMFDACEARSYANEAIVTAADGFRRQGELGLKRVVVIVTTPLVRMGVSVVAMSSGMDLRIVETRAEAECHILGSF